MEPQINQRFAELQDLFLHKGFSQMEETEILELLLGYLKVPEPRSCAESLLKRYGALHFLLTVEPQDLTEEPLLPERDCGFFRTIRRLVEYDDMWDAKPPCSFADTRESIRYVRKILRHADRENLLLLCLDARNRLIERHLFCEDSLCRSSVTLRLLCNKALAASASSILIAHNHPGGIALPSPNDDLFTKDVLYAMGLLQVDLLDHIIVASAESCYSYSLDRKLDRIRQDVVSRVSPGQPFRLPYARLD